MPLAPLLLFFALLCLVSPVSAAERLRVVEERGFRGASDPGPRQRIIADLDGSTPAQRALIARLWAEHAVAFPPEHRSFAVPDAGGIRISLEHAGESIIVFSCHTGFEHNAGLVATATAGIAPLSGRSREEVVREQPVWFQRFRAGFEAILAAAQRFREP